MGLGPGWPDWAIFRLLGDCLLWAFLLAFGWIYNKVMGTIHRNDTWNVTEVSHETWRDMIWWVLSLLWAIVMKIIRVAQTFWLLFPRYKLCLNFDKNGSGYILGHFFHTPIWSPCLGLDFSCVLWWLDFLFLGPMLWFYIISPKNVARDWYT
jgi:hypothetical protein